MLRPRPQQAAVMVSVHRENDVGLSVTKARHSTRLVATRNQAIAAVSPD
jgi:hypothetical protein